MSTQQWIAQKFASYSIATSSVPLEFQLSEKTETLAKQNIPLYTMRKELEVQIKFPLEYVCNFNKQMDTVFITDCELVFGFSYQ